MMGAFSSDVTHLIYKGLQRRSPVNDKDYRDLLARYQTDGSFRRAVEDAAEGQELQVLEDNPHGIVLAPRSRQSLYSLQLSDLRQSLKDEQKVTCALVLLCICTVFFPSTASLESDSIASTQWTRPAKITDFREKISELIERTRVDDAPPELVAGWSLLERLADVTSRDQRASLSSREGLVLLVLGWLEEYKLVRKEKDKYDDNLSVYHATHRLRSSLRFLAHPGLFNFVCEAKRDGGE